MEDQWPLRYVYSDSIKKWMYHRSMDAASFKQNKIAKFQSGMCTPVN